MAIEAWTFSTVSKDSCPFGKSRILLRFDQMTCIIPFNAVSTLATLKLFGGDPREDSNHTYSSFPNSPYAIYAPSPYGSNTVNICGVTSSYSMSTVTWHTEPSFQGTSTVIPESNVSS